MVFVATYLPSHWLILRHRVCSWQQTFSRIGFFWKCTVHWLEALVLGVCIFIYECIVLCKKYNSCHLKLFKRFCVTKVLAIIICNVYVYIWFVTMYPSGIFNKMNIFGQAWASPTLAWLHCLMCVYVFMSACGHIPKILIERTGFKFAHVLKQIPVRWTYSMPMKARLRTMIDKGRLLTDSTVKSCTVVAFASGKGHA